MLGLLITGRHLHFRISTALANLIYFNGILLGRWILFVEPALVLTVGEPADGHEAD
jgi:hypothetical protein